MIPKVSFSEFILNLVHAVSKVYVVGWMSVEKRSRKWNWYFYDGDGDFSVSIAEARVYDIEEALQCRRELAVRNVVEAKDGTEEVDPDIQVLEISLSVLDVKKVDSEFRCPSCEYYSTKLSHWPSLEGRFHCPKCNKPLSRANMQKHVTIMKMLTDERTKTFRFALEIDSEPASPVLITEDMAKEYLKAGATLKITR